jgi:hypothetical protein
MCTIFFSILIGAGGPFSDYRPIQAKKTGMVHQSKSFPKKAVTNKVKDMVRYWSWRMREIGLEMGVERGGDG